jgi:hypothetical protein
MAMLADAVEVVIGVDTHKHTHTAAVVAPATGQSLASLTVAATPAGSQRCWSSPTSIIAGECGRLRAPAATAPG